MTNTITLQYRMKSNARNDSKSGTESYVTFMQIYVTYVTYVRQKDRINA